MNEFIIHAPGRVNLLGEHTDYNGLPVLPMAINRAIRIEGAPLPDAMVRVRAADFHDDSAEFRLQTPIEKHPAGHWANYVKAGMQGVIDGGLLPDAKSLRGCELVLSGSIPPNAGLSSSSALVVASALALLKANGFADRFEPLERGLKLADCMARAEHYVGTRGGGMDQAACLLAKRGHAMKIDFFPLNARHVPFPGEIAAVICDSMVEAKKSADALLKYNLRAAECRLAMMAARKALRDEPGGKSIERLGDLLRPPWSWTYPELGRFAQETLQDEYSLEDLKRTIQDDAAIHEALSDFGFEPQSWNTLAFRCGKRFRHVVSEGWRVEQSAAALGDHDLKTFARLINEGHQSARDDFEISCEALEHLVEAARGAGALASRLTGAGFGGCVVNLVAQSQANALVNRMRDCRSNMATNASRAAWISEPCDGALKRMEQGESQVVER